MQAFLSRPWLHFMLLGALLYAVMSSVFPEPMPQLGPPAESRLVLMSDNFFELTRRRPNETEWASLIDRELREELLFREAVGHQLHLRDSAVAQRLILNMRFLDSDTSLSDSELVQQGLALRMHLTDEVIRRRLVQVMERLLAASASIAPPTESVLLERWEANQDEYVVPERYSFAQVFLPSERAAEREEIGSVISQGDLSAVEARQLGGPFLAGFEFDTRSIAQLQRQFGTQFVAAFVASEKRTDSWVGPLASTYGLHWLYIRDVTPERLRPLDEVRVKIERSWRAEQESAAVDTAVARLMAKYEVRRS